MSTIVRIKSVVKRIPLTKRIWRNTLAFVKAGKVVIDKLRYREAYVEHLFTEIHETNFWGDPESRSGEGSNLKATEVVRTELASLLRELSVKTLLDIPCGDFTWMKEVDLPSDLLYVGGDIVDDLVRKNNDLYGNNRISFRKMDLLRDSLPAMDLILCRDCLVHFSFPLVFRALKNLKRSGSKYLLTTHFTGDRQNREIETGQWRPLILTAPPFNLPSPFRSIDERNQYKNGKYADKCLALYRLADVPGLSDLEL